MTRAIILPLVLVLTVCGRAQDWSLFPLDERSYHAEIISPENSLVHMRLFDSTRTTMEGLVTYSRRKLEIGGADGCSGSIADSYFLPHEDFDIDSLLERNDTIFYWYDWITSPFYFLPRAQVGQSWTITSTWPGNDYSDITITCTGVTEESFCGVTDSVKTFDLAGSGFTPLIDPLKMRLSKSHGLIEHIPFGQFIYHPSTQPYLSLGMIGFEADSTAHGFKPPVFDDYFHPLIGDILLWKEEFDSDIPWITDWVRYHRDSITMVVNTPDSIVAYFDRTTVNEDNTVVDLSGQSVVFNRHDLNLLVECPPHWFTAPTIQGVSPGMLWYGYMLELQFEGGSADTVVAMVLSSAWVLDTLSCFVGEVSDLGYGTALDTRAGFTGHSEWLNPNTHSFQLIGSLIDGDLQGNVELSVPTIASAGIGALHVYPNPAREQLFLKVPGLHGAMDFTVHNLAGKVMLAGQLATPKLFIGDLPPGLYALRLTTEDGSFFGTFVHE